MEYRVTSPSAIACQVQLPLSKSIAVREMLLNDLVDQESGFAGALPQVAGYQSCEVNDDIAVMMRSLLDKGERINVGGSGTAMRLLTARLSMQEGRTVELDGDARMRQRPIGILVDALRQMGANIHYLGQEGFPPLKIEGRKLSGGSLSLDGSVSSQYISALLMIAPLAGGITLVLDGTIASRPYIEMTLSLMRHHGIASQWSGTSIVVPGGHYVAAPLAVEGDWSAASHWLMLKSLLPQSTITLHGLKAHSLQGDSAIVEIMKPLGVATVIDSSKCEVTLHTCPSTIDKMPAPYERDMRATPDLVPALVVTLCLLRKPFTITGVESLRIKESDRLAALRQELAKLGYTVETGAGNIHYDGNHNPAADDVILDPHGDHRMAMALSLASTRHPGMAIKDPQVVSKSYPQWWEHLAKANFTIDR